ncbi:hypothetical protein AVEN_86021-1 [Araneus ventricosus]|uniref:Uncharacterized protein n=1 Tax=Araneus ventricosus TaxID=182803 RepID=A0A4Y2U5C2_ARAVE|nr:hypothetical protein AVEN_86021-1 [Araneus ventricosus]
MEIYATVVETEDRYSVNAAVYKKDLPQLMNFEAIEVAEIPDESDENSILGNIQDFPEKIYVLDENVFEDAKKTVEDIIETVAVVEEDILEPVMVTQDILETVTVIEDDILETVTVVAEKILPFFKSDEISPMPFLGVITKP